MASATIALAIVGIIVMAWANIRAAAEVASEYGRRACLESGVQWLDHTVMLEHFSLVRAPDGWIRPRRRYRFEFSVGGNDRYRGHLELIGTRLQWVHMPPPPEPEPKAPEEPPPAASSWKIRVPL